MGFSIIPVKDIDIPFAGLQAKQPEIERFSASTLIFLFDPHEPLTSYVLLCQRALLGKDENGNDKKNSWPFSWEPPWGSQEKFDKTILSTARRETKEEVKTCTARTFLVRSTWIRGYTREFRWQDTHFLWKFMSHSSSNEHGATASSIPSVRMKDPYG
jgi:8-oxo-dGTP pyrophosphatase MutT (NUDIX family)